ncbi:MAG TPA: carboxy-S-adenosyl-L-methionine synthase CmoA [Desulfobulbaceae bacterium]|nr:carboxy-S-adenosyl-L-methionine synthase CmoA [Desulfobulbaceae bacterium]
MTDSTDSFPPTTDRIFVQPLTAADFVFDAQVSAVFDDMANRSVPGYHEVITMSGRLLASFLENGDTICDLGCATGETILALSRQLQQRLPERRFDWLGLDSSQAMVEKARDKARLAQTDDCHFAVADIMDYDYPAYGAFILHYTLQFIRPMQRQALLTTLFRALKTGGILLLSEKVIVADRLFSREFIARHLEFKRNHGYSALEIAQKREALENVLVPFSIEENLTMLRQAGFAEAAVFYQWFNFASFIAVKGE